MNDTNKDDWMPMMNLPSGLVSGHLERMDSGHVFHNMRPPLDVSGPQQEVRKLTRQESQSYIGDVDTSSLFSDLDRSIKW